MKESKLTFHLGLSEGKAWGCVCGGATGRPGDRVTWSENEKYVKRMCGKRVEVGS